MRRSYPLSLSLLIISLGASADSAAPIAHLDPAGSIGPEVAGATGDALGFLFPVAGNVQGAFGTHFKSDITIINYRDVPQRISLQWWEQGKDNFFNSRKYLQVPAASSLTVEDVVGQVLGVTGIGAIEVEAVDSFGIIDTDGKLDGYSRIWTKQPNAEGTVSQSLPATHVFHLSGSDPAYIFGVRQNPDFRTNVAIVSTDTGKARTWDVTVNGSTGRTETFEITVQPTSFTQVAIPAGDFGHMTITLRPRADVVSYWTAYASSVDNRSGDGWISQATRPFKN